MASSKGIKAGRAFVELDAVDKTAKVLRAVQRRLMRIGDTITGMGKRMMLSASAMAAPFGLSLKVFADFDDAMRKVGARTNSTAAEMKGLREQAKELGRTTAFTASQVAGLMGTLGQKGFGREDISAMTPAAMNLALAGGSGTEDAELAADVISGTLRAFQLDASEATRVADVLTAAVNNSNFTLEGLKTSLAKSAPLASQYGLSLEEVVAALASMTNLNIEASSAGQALNSFFARMSNEGFTETFNQALEEAGAQTIEFADAAGNLRSPLEILAEIQESMKSMGTAKKGSILAEMFGTEQFGKAVGAASGMKASLSELLPLLQQSQGAAANAANEMGAGLGGAFRSFSSAVEGVAIAIGEALAPKIQAMANLLAGSLGKITEFVQKHQDMVVAIAGGIAAFGAAGAALLVLGPAITMVATAFGALATVATLVTTIIGGAVAIVGTLPGAIAAVVVVLIGFTGKLHELGDVFGSTFSGMRESAGRTFGTISEVIGQTMDNVMMRLTAGDIEGAFKAISAGIKVIWAELMMFMKDQYYIWERSFIKGLGKLADVLPFTMDAAFGINTATVDQMLVQNVTDQWNAISEQRKKQEEAQRELEAALNRPIPIAAPADQELDAVVSKVESKRKREAESSDASLPVADQELDAVVNQVGVMSQIKSAIDGIGDLIPGGAGPDLAMAGNFVMPNVSQGPVQALQQGTSAAFARFHQNKSENKMAEMLAQQIQIQKKIEENTRDDDDDTEVI